jgi:uncharacterized protein YjbI with pentapeptide repeats
MKFQSLALLAFPLLMMSPAMALELKDFKGNFKLVDGLDSCHTKITLNPQAKSLFVFKVKNGELELIEQFPIGKSKVGDITTEGYLKDETIFVEEYKAGLFGKKKAISSRSINFQDNRIILEKNKIECAYDQEIAVSSERTNRGVDLTVSPNKKYVPLNNSFSKASELLDVENAEKVLDTLSNLKSATMQYHQELLEVLGSAGKLSLEQIKMIPKLAYYSPEDQSRIYKILVEVKPQDRTAKLSEHAELAGRFAYSIQTIILRHSDDVKEIKVSDFIKFLKAMPKDLQTGFVNPVIVSYYQRKLAKPDENEKKELLKYYIENVQEQITEVLAADIFKAEKGDFTFDELLLGSKEIYPKKPLSVFRSLFASISDLNRENALKAFKLFDNDSSFIYDVLSKTKGKISWTSQDLLNFKDLNIDLSTLRSVGFSAQELADAGYSLKSLVEAGFNITNELKKVFTAKDFKNSGFDASTLRYYSYSSSELKEAGFSLKDLVDAQYNITNDLKKIFKITEFKAIGFDASTLRYYGYSAQEIKEAGFSLQNLIDAQFNIVNDLKKLYSIKDFKGIGFDASTLKYYGYSSSEIKNAGFTLQNLIDAQFNIVNDLKKLYTIKDFKGIGFDASTLKYYGYSAVEIRDAGFLLQDLVSAGFSIERDLKSLFNVSDFLKAGFDYSTLRYYRFSAKELRASGASLEDLRNAGFSDSELAGL